MSSGPFLTPGQAARRRAAAVRRRRRRLAAGVTALVLLIAGAVYALSGKGPGPDRARSAAAPAPAAAPARRPLSQTGLPLAAPALKLTGLTGASSDPIRLTLHHPPAAGLLFNVTTGQVLWQLRPERRLRIASLTKLMTALIAVESSPPRAPVLVTRQAVDANGSKVGELPLGRRVAMESMLYGLLLPSGNDAAIAIAQHVSGTVPAFVQRMNREAARLGLGCTRFSSPSGYYNHGNYSCAADLAVLAHVDLAQPRIARITSTYQAILPFPIKGGRLYLYNNNPLLIYGYPGTTGLKTGYTIEAGRCLIGTAERDGVRLGAVILNSTEPGNQVRRLLDRGFRDVYHLPAVPEQPFPPGA